MKTFRKPLAQAIAIAAFGFAAQAHADTLFQDRLYGPAITADVNVTTAPQTTVLRTTTGLGPMQIDNSSKVDANNNWQQFIAYCFQPLQDINGAMAALGTTPIGGSGWDYTAQAITNTAINQLFDLYYQGTIQGTTVSQTVTDNGAAFQLALWDLEGYNPVTIAANLHGTPTDIASLESEAHQYYVDASDPSLHASQHYKLTEWVAGSLTDASGAVSTSQDFISARVVPEPGSLALLGLGLMGLISSRRRTA